MQWLLAPVIPELRRLRLEDFCEFEASLGYKANSESTRTV